MYTARAAASGATAWLMPLASRTGILGRNGLIELPFAT